MLCSLKPLVLAVAVAAFVPAVASAQQPAKATERLAILQKACGDCAEYRELKEKIAQTASN